jgi:hypothetical protein
MRQEHKMTHKGIRRTVPLSFIALAMLILFACPLRTPDEDPVLLAGSPITLVGGTLAPQWLTLNAVTGSAYQLGFSVSDAAAPSFSDTSSLTMRLYASDKSTLIATKSGAFLEFIPQNTGKFCIEVTPSSDSALSGYRVLMEEPSLALLSADTWSNGSLESNQTAWYRFDGVAGVSYSVIWNDGNDGDGTKSADLRVSAYGVGADTVFFLSQADGFDTPRSITPPTTGPIVLMVKNVGTASGTYSLKIYESVPSIPLTDDVWMDGTVSSVGPIWYSFDAVAGEIYYVNWNESGGSNYGDGSKTADILVEVYDQDRKTLYDIESRSSGYKTSHRIIARKTGVIYIHVLPGSTTVPGETYGIKYRHAIPTPLSDNAWTSATVITGGESWFSFPCQANELYYLVWYEQTAQLSVSAYASDKTTAYFSDLSYGGTPPHEIIPNADGNVFIKVASVDPGTYKIRYCKATLSPLAEGVWSNGTAEYGDILWYSFQAADGRVFDVSWNQAGSAEYGDGTMTGGMEVTAYASDRTTPIFADAYGAYAKPRSIVPPWAGTVCLKITIISSGTFALRYAETSTLIPLTENGWTDGIIALGQTLWYSFPVDSGERYNVNWNESGSGDYGDGTKTASISVTGYCNGTQDYSFDDLSSGGYVPNSVIQAYADGIAVIKVTSSGAGTFAVRYGNDPPIALSDDVWMDGTLPPTGILWYSFPCVEGDIYLIYLNRSNSYPGDGDGTKSAIVDMTARETNCKSAYFYDETYAYTYPASITARETGKINIDVTWAPILFPTHTGSYALKYKHLPVALAQGAWHPDAKTSSELKIYSFPVTAGTQYSIFWDDYYSGSGTYTADIFVTGKIGDTILFSSSDAAYFTPQIVMPSASGTLKLFIESGSGTYAIRYTSP